MTRRVNTAAQIALPDAPQARILAGRTQPQAAAIPRVSVDGTRATIRIYGTIVSDSWWGSDNVSSRDVAKALDELDPSVTEIQVRLNSPGGSAFDGVAILNALRAHPAKVTAVVDGYAASAASTIAVGCDETYMSPGATLMIHNPSAGAWGKASDLQKVVGMLTSLQTSMATLYAEAAGAGTAEDWVAVMEAETWYTAEEAVAAGLADEVAVVPNAGQAITAGAEDQDDEDDDELLGDDDELLMQLAQFGYRYAGREHAPAPTQLGAAALGPKPPSAGPRSGSTNQQEEAAMTFSSEQLNTMRQDLGLAETADEATIVAALSEALNERAEAPVAPTATAVPEGMSLIETDVLAELRSGAADGRAARTEQVNARRDGLIAAAVATGRISPARREHWVAQFTADFEGAEQTLAALEPGLIPVVELGHAVVPENTPELSEGATSAFAAGLGIPKEALNG